MGKKERETVPDCYVTDKNLEGVYISASVHNTSRKKKA